jgi:hypothetical protein
VAGQKVRAKKRQSQDLKRLKSPDTSSKHKGTQNLESWAGVDLSEQAWVRACHRNLRLHLTEACPRVILDLSKQEGLREIPGYIRLYKVRPQTGGRDEQSRRVAKGDGN